MKKYNTAYVECFDEIWDYYFKIDNLLYTPIVLIGEKRQVSIVNRMSAKFYNRADVNNLDVKFHYELSSEENKKINEISNSIILFKMFYRNLLDEELDKQLYNELVTEYCRFWFYLIRQYNLEALILHEMPHIPYSYIGYLIFKSLGLITIFSSTFPIKGKTFITNSIENYCLFNRHNDQYSTKDKLNNEENNFYNDKLVQEFSIAPNAQPRKSVPFLKAMLVTIRNFLFPQKFQRLQFKVIYKNRFHHLNDRKYYLLMLLRILRKHFDKKLYIKLSSDFTPSEKLKIFFALHFEPELAVYPLAGENFNQFEIIKDLSKQIGERGTVYIKEHPWVFDYSKPKGIIRQKHFYEGLINLKNVKFLDYTADVSKLIDKIDLMVTLTGTIGWEAFLKKIPVLYYGYPWYAGLPGTRKYFSDFNVGKVIAKCRHEYEFINYKNVYTLLNNSILNVSVKLKALSEIDFLEKVVILKSGIETSEFQER